MIALCQPLGFALFQGVLPHWMNSRCTEKAEALSHHTTKGFGSERTSCFGITYLDARSASMFSYLRLMNRL